MAETLSNKARQENLFKLRPGSSETCGPRGMQNSFNVNQKGQQSGESNDGAARSVAHDTKRGSPIEVCMSPSVLFAIKESM
ncbi:unnamed protein product [Anisakis simplex]|uniref:Uncharacterized protein n=1 Tax=Anisakis simplex TaxID=6269 RepID=A0A3P6PE42_ANISI|nr:unnamed protein product [Anisakis simplex]